MAVAVGCVGHEDRLSPIDHLEELRVRLIISLAALAVSFGLCMWQNHTLLSIVNRPLEHQTQKQVRAGDGPLGATYSVQQDAHAIASQLELLIVALERPGSGASQRTRTVIAPSSAKLQGVARSLSQAPQGDKPVTLGIGEPFTSTVGIALLFALILALPIILFELYGFVLPAFSPDQRRGTTKLVVAMPILFVAGVTFGYFVVLPAAIRFFQNFNSNQFNVLVQASQYYHFAATTLMAMGLLFQVPVGILAVTRAGIVTPRALRKHRRYAVLACGAVAAFLPGDAITLVLETVPLYLLFELGVILASVVERHERRLAVGGRGEKTAGT